MSWFWGTGGSSDKDDPLSRLDPGLKEFLEQETPETYRPATKDAKASQEESDQSYRTQLGIGEEPRDARKAQEAAQPDTTTRPLPKQSLFQDGRYKHLWKSYRPLNELEEAGKSDQDKLNDIVAAYKQRKAEVYRAALENCANEQWDLSECFRTGGWQARMTMCKTENRCFDRCLTMQGKFLRALGYMSMYERSQEQMEDIQLHADTLYRRMLRQEKLINEARERGEEPPGFERLIPERNPVRDPGAEPQGVFANIPRPDQRPGLLRWETLTPEAQEQYKKRFENLTPEEYQIERAALDGEMAMDEVMAFRLDEHYKRDRRERLERLAAGKERASDKIKRWFDLRDWSKFDREEQERQQREGQQKDSTSQ